MDTHNAQAPVYNDQAPVNNAQAPVAAVPAKQGPIDNKDVDDWKNRFNAALANPQEITGPAAHDARPWHAGMFECFSPIDTCAITCCVPCVTFGKTHHRTRKHANMEGYNAVNTSCIMVGVSAFFGLSIIPLMMQRIDVRKKYNLQGSFVSDLLLNCCCGCCTLIQTEKESAFREAEIAKGGAQQYAQIETMNYIPKA
ncbi:PLAC8-domain-containing protein [Tothia fuscella]|uniref:PLAC8-domain-containing protein n=1 Tax=Tothia fuscella TaxID=1048955 RepID=A0A9P4TZR0_9PEZI|nr:PLAC8-domain-containing protein [Tothia fuscella]